MNLNELKSKVNAHVSACDDPELLEMIARIFEDSSVIIKEKSFKKDAERVGKVSYSDVLRQGQGCLPPGK